MTDGLRGRIAAAIQSIRIQRAGDAEEMADAVIRELGRYEYAVATADMEFVYMYSDERSELNGFPLHPGEQIVRRYATDWEPDNA